MLSAMDWNLKAFPWVRHQLYYSYAYFKDTQTIVATTVGIEALGQLDRLHLEFGEKFEEKLINQGNGEDRELDYSLDLAWAVLRTFPSDSLSKIPRYYLENHFYKEGVNICLDKVGKDNQDNVSID